MGRKIRRVPPNWEHPKDDDGNFQPLLDRGFDEALAEWLEGYELWKNGEHPDQTDKDGNKRDYEFWEWWGSPPNPEYYRPDWQEEPTHYQAYENVSEGTPISPPFATTDELITYLVEEGDYWGNKWHPEAAASLVKHSYAPSMMMFASPEKVDIRMAHDKPLERE